MNLFEKYENEKDDDDELDREVIEFDPLFDWSESVCIVEDHY